MRLSTRSARGPEGVLGALLVALSCAGLAFWFVVGLPWGPHNEAFDWIVRLEQRDLWAALFEKFPSVLSLRPIGTGAAWALYRLGGHDDALIQVVNAAFAMLAWGWAAAGERDRRWFALVSLVAGGVFFAGYIWVFHLHGIFYGPLLLFLAAMVRAARGPLDLRTLLGVFVGALVTALAHPYALPLAVAFVAGATLETPLLRTRAGAGAIAVVVTGVTVAYLMLVPSYNRDLGGDPLLGLVTSYRTTEVNVVGSAVAALLAAWTASRALTGPAGGVAALLSLGLAIAAIAMGAPVLPLWFAWAAIRSLRHKRITLAALLAGCALLPVANPTGSPTYAVFAVFVAVCATVVDEPGVEGMLHALRPVHVAGLLVVMGGVAIALRFGAPVPGVAAVARPLLAEGERTRQLEEVARTLMASPWRSHPARFLAPALNPTETDATDRRFRPPTEDAHLTTWLDWMRGGPATAADTLVLTFGGQPAPGLTEVLRVRGRYAGDALVWRRVPDAAAGGASPESRP